MTKELIFETENEFQDYLIKEKYNFSKHIVEQIFHLIDNKLNRIKIANILIKSSGIIFEVVLEEQDLIKTLEENLIIYTEEEDYEGCKKIYDTIKLLKENQKI